MGVQGLFANLFRYRCDKTSGLKCRVQDLASLFICGPCWLRVGSILTKLSPMVPRWQPPASRWCGYSLSVSYWGERNSESLSFHFHCLIGPEWVYVPFLELKPGKQGALLGLALGQCSNLEHRGWKYVDPERNVWHYQEKCDCMLGSKPSSISSEFYPGLSEKWLRGLWITWNCRYKFMFMSIYQGKGRWLWLDYQRPLKDLALLR